MTEKFGMFFFYSFLLSIYQRVLGGSAGFWPNLVVGYVADLCRLPFTYPIELAAVAVQASPAGTSVGSVVRYIVSTKGLAGLYAGASSYVGFAVRPAIQQTIYDQLKARVLPGGGELAFGTAFGFGAIGRFFAMMFAYPCAAGSCLLPSPSPACWLVHLFALSAARDPHKAWVVRASSPCQDHRSNCAEGAGRATGEGSGWRPAR